MCTSARISLVLLVLALTAIGTAHAMSPPCTALFEAREQTRLARTAMDDDPKNWDRMEAWLDARDAERDALEWTHANVPVSATRELLDGLREGCLFNKGLGKPAVVWMKQPKAPVTRNRVAQTIMEISTRQYEAWVTVAEIDCRYPQDR